MFEQVKEILANYSSIPEDQITRTTSLQKDLGLNSLDVINVVVDFEETFDMEIEEAAVRSFADVGDIVDYLEANLPHGAFA